MNNQKENAGERRIIGLVGYGTAHDGSFRSTAGVGKDTVADILIRDKGYVKAAFADPIKHAARFLFGLDKEEAWGREKKEVRMADWGFSPRELMRRFGTEFARYRIGASVWLDVMSHRLSLPPDRQFVGNRAAALAGATRLPGHPQRRHTENALGRRGCFAFKPAAAPHARTGGGGITRTLIQTGGAVAPLFIVIF